MFKFTSIALMILSLSACAGGPRLEAMIADVAINNVITESSPLWKSTGIGKITGSTKPNNLWKTKVSKQVFEDALRQTLSLHAVLSESGGTYKVSAILKELRQPFLGLELAVTARVEYKVIRTVDNVVVFNREITKTHTSTLNDSFVFSDRLKLANEGAVKENIKKFIGVYIEESRNSPQLFNLPPSS
jgi:hypothetical protein